MRAPIPRRDEGLEVTNYLIGNVWRPANGKPEFLPFFTSTSAGEEANLRAFLDWASSLDEPVFYHWHHYERTHLKKMCEFYQVDPVQVDWVMERLVNLVPPVTDSFAFPCYGRGLKDIAKVLGFRWRQDDVDAAGSVVLYRRFVGSGGTDVVSKEKILIYNEDDCMATMHVFDWLMAQEG
ncbi:MAG: TM0106 family RecB-like putative nuclease [Chloroflexi bacterium]|nr:TM0106 family RecB-like putative nuclease [Chloroflexota bacterium]